MEKLYDIQFKVPIDDITTYMYYRSKFAIFSDMENNHILKKKFNYDFFTYYNSLSIGKWRTFTRLKDFFLVLKAKGDFELHVFGHYRQKNGVIKKEYLMQSKMNAKDVTEFVIPIPRSIQSSVVGFSIYPHKKTKIVEAYYGVDMTGIEVNNINVSLVTTTFKKEAYVEKNIDLINQYIFSDENYASHFHWYIIDNGQSMDSSLQTEHITIISNPNVGGAGGFARGMIESIRDGKYSHVLLMDDDVRMTPESIKRLYLLLKFVKEKYAGRFISGAMLKMEEPNVQHEDVGVFDVDGRHRPAKNTLDLNYWDSVVINESELFDDGRHYYAGWWFCCIPAKYVTDNNLPLPIFVRGDDVEYSLRNNPGFITMNGICIWHEGFEGKFSAAMEFYQVERNELIIESLYEDLQDVDVIGRIEKFFWEEIYKFNYKGATLLLDSLEDYLKGPDYVFALDGAQVMKDKKEQDNQLEPLTGDVRALIPYDTLYNWDPVKGKLRKFIYDYTCNGQFRIPKIFCRNGLGVIPYGWGYFQSKMCLVDTIYAVDLRSETYCIYKKNRAQFRKLRARHKILINRFFNENDYLKKAYKDAFAKEISIEAWGKKTLS